MIKTFYISYNDLDISMKDELLEAGEKFVEEQLKQEAIDLSNSTKITEYKSILKYPDWKSIIKDLYDLETDQDLNNFIMSKAEDIITTAFRKVPFELELKFK